jgi:hypothetical protein
MVGAARFVLLVTCLACSSTLKMEAVRSLEISVNSYRNTRRHIPGYSTPYFHPCKGFNIKQSNFLKGMHPVVLAYINLFHVPSEHICEFCSHYQCIRVY